MQCHEVDYEIFGDDMQVVEVELDPGETVVAEVRAQSSAVSVTCWMEIIEQVTSTYPTGAGD